MAAGFFCLLLNPSGSRWWRLDYRFGGKRKTLSMGVYPAVPLKAARINRDEARGLFKQDTDPGEKRKEDKNAETPVTANTFKATCVG